MPLNEKVAIITGAGQGLGKAYAKRLVQEGIKVVIADINGEKAESTAAEINAEGFEALAIKVDISDESSTQNMVEKVIEKWGRVDILINNAAYFSTIKMKPFEEISAEEWDFAMAVNLKGTFLCCKAVTPYMKKQRSGTIINASSGTVLEGRPLYLHYVTTKSGIIGFTRSLAREVGEYGITVNTICPGLTLTDVPRTTITDSDVERVVSRQAIKRPGVSEDLAGTVAFLVSDEAKFITGQLFNVDGGTNMN